MPLRPLLNVAYAALADGKDDDGIKELDAALTDDGGKKQQRRRDPGIAALMAAARMPQPGAPGRPSLTVVDGGGES